mmetsp:Transcript_13933/g.38026  ORF Transcript_13933/g.38026 Transcript_13933/m.38026 type:complete len:278 (+) Transcript_13933:821-1654(+)
MLRKDCVMAALDLFGQGLAPSRQQELHATAIRGSLLVNSCLVEFLLVLDSLGSSLPSTLLLRRVLPRVPYFYYPALLPVYPLADAGHGELRRAEIHGRAMEDSPCRLMNFPCLGEVSASLLLSEGHLQRLVELGLQVSLPFVVRLPLHPVVCLVHDRRLSGQVTLAEMELLHAIFLRPELVHVLCELLLLGVGAGGDLRLSVELRELELPVLPLPSAHRSPRRCTSELLQRPDLWFPCGDDGAGTRDQPPDRHRRGRRARGWSSRFLLFIPCGLRKL